MASSAFFNCNNYCKIEIELQHSLLYLVFASSKFIVLALRKRQKKRKGNNGETFELLRDTQKETAMDNEGCINI